MSKILLAQAIPTSTPTPTSTPFPFNFNIQWPAINFQQMTQGALGPHAGGGSIIQRITGISITDPTLTIGVILSALLPLVLVIAGLIFFGLLIFAGFELLISGGDVKKVESAKNKLTGGIAGLIIIFAAYWIAQILEVIFNIKILGD